MSVELNKKVPQVRKPNSVALIPTGLPGNVKHEFQKIIPKSKLTPPSFPAQFSAQFLYGSCKICNQVTIKHLQVPMELGITISRTKDKGISFISVSIERIEFFELKHNFVQLYLYQKAVLFIYCYPVEPSLLLL